MLNEFHLNKKNYIYFVKLSPELCIYCSVHSIGPKSNIIYFLI